MRLFLIEWPNTVPVLVEIVAELKKRGHKIQYWSGFNQKSIDKTSHPETIFHDYEDALAGIPANGIDTKRFAAPDERLLKDLAWTESIVLTMMNKKFELLSVSERKHLYYDLVGYWNGVLNLLNPEMIIFWNVPHTVYDFILYALAKKIGIKTSMAEYTLIGDRVILENTYERGNEQLRELLSSNRNQYTLDDLPNDIKSYYLRQISTDSQFIPHYVQDYLKMYSGWNALKFKAMMVIKSLANLSFFSKSVKYVEKLFKKNIKDEYQSLQVEPVWDKKFIYVPFHFQPESTTSPQGGVFTDQILLVEIISQCAPRDCLIYVKEHPTQWSPWGDNYSSYRYPGYYKHLAKLPNVRLVPISTPSRQLIKNSYAVATVTGTAGWEAVLCGKPVVVFGFPWYRHCPGVFKVDGTESCGDIMEKISKGFEIKQQDIINYLYFLSKVTFHGYYDSAIEKISKITPEENKQNFLNALLYYVEDQPL